MGFGFNLFFVFIILPLSGILILSMLITRKMVFGKILGYLWLGLIGLVIFSTSIQKIFSKKILSKQDYYGEYVIDRSFFKGLQADWQYNRYRFEITKEDSLFFYVTLNENILETYKGTVSSTDAYQSARLIVEMDLPSHHVMSSNPTTYRSTWSYYLVFRSPEYYNMFFKKGKWKPLR